MTDYIYIYIYLLLLVSKPKEKKSGPLAYSEYHGTGFGLLLRSIFKILLINFNI